MGSRFQATAGLCAVLYLVVQSFSWESVEGKGAPSEPPTHRLRLLAVGDVNLGRQVGQEILRGDTLFPFAMVVDTFAAYDIVFANLECTLSDQNGETQHPRNNLIFTGPPAGAMSLKKAGITIVSTANNHALDYGARAHAETIQYLDEAGIRYAGTSEDNDLLFRPTFVTKDSITIAFFACTDIMNTSDPEWKKYVAGADTTRLLPAIRSCRDLADYIVVSVHGGEEYAPSPTKRTEWFAQQVMDAGADLVLGHHPHVPHGIKATKGKLTVYSLGNFAFYQPFQEWTQKSFALSATIVKNAGGTQIESFRCLPVATGLQPFFTRDTSVASSILARIQRSSFIDQDIEVVW